MLRASLRMRVLPVVAALALLGCEAEVITDGSGDIGAGTLALLVVSGNNQTGPAGLELPLPLVVKVTGPGNLPLKGQVVNFVVTVGGGRVFAGTAVTNAQGIAKEYWTLGTVAGAAQTLEVRAVHPGSGAKVVFGTFTATAAPGPAASLTKLQGDNQTGLPGLPLTDSLKVQVVDQFGNPVGGVAVAWAATQGGGSVSYANVPTSGSGIAAAEWTVGPNGAQTAVASVGALTTSFGGTVFLPLSSTQLVYAENDNNALSIYSMMGDGSGRQFLNVGTGPTQQGNLILARGDYQDNGIYAMDGLGNNRLQILGAGPSYAPDLSPDGARFVLMYGDCPGGHPIATANADGSGLVVLPICSTQPPRWSPLGDRIAYSYGATIYTAKTDGSDIQDVITLTPDLGGPAWSPQGSGLVFSWKPDVTGNFGIYTVDTDGTNLHQVTNVTADDYVQDWSLAGDWIAFFSTRSGSMALWVMLLDGSHVQQVPTSAAPPDAVRWRR